MAAESASFREAATRLGISPQTVTRAVQELEAHFGEVLFHRSTRQSRVTAFGEAIALQGKQSLLQFDELFRDTRTHDHPEAPTKVRVTAPRALGRMHVLPALTRLAREHPHIIIDLRLADEIADVVDEQIDVGVRIGFMRDNRFVARAVSQTRFLVVGTPELLARSGKPSRVEDLAGMPTTDLLDSNTGKPWRWYFSEGRQVAPATPVFLTDDPAAELEAVLAGVGYGQLPHFLAAPYLADGSLVSVLDEHAPAPWGNYVYRPQRSPVAPRVRLVFDTIVQCLMAV